MRTVSSPGSSTLTQAAVTEPKTGKEFALARVTLGLSLNRVAAELGIAHHTLQRWEMDPSPLSAADARNWRKALSAAAVYRVSEINRYSLSIADLGRTHLGKVLAVYVKTAR